MSLLTKKAVLIFCLIFIFSIQHSYSQDETNKWVFGIGLNTVDFYPTNDPGNGNTKGMFNQFANAIDHWNVFLPKISATRHIKNKFSIEAAVSVNNITKLGENKIDNTLYFSIDGALQYVLFNDSRKLAPFVYAGGGYTWMDWYGAGTINAGLGTKYWIGSNFGLDVQAGYKYSDQKYEQLLSHFYYALSAVFTFGRRSKSKWGGNANNCY